MKYNYDDGIKKNNEEIATIRKQYDEHKIGKIEAEQRINELNERNKNLEKAKQEEARTLGSRIRGFFSGLMNKGKETKLGLSAKNHNIYKECQKMLDEYYIKYKDKNIIDIKLDEKTLSNFNHIDITLKALFGKEEKLIFDRLSVNQQIIYKKIVEKLKHEFKLNEIERRSKESSRSSENPENTSPIHEDISEPKPVLPAESEEENKVVSPGTPDVIPEERKANKLDDESFEYDASKIEKLGLDKLRKYLVLLRRSRRRGRLNVEDKECLNKIRQKCGISIFSLNDKEIALLEKKRLNGSDGLTQEEKKMIDTIYDKIESISKKYDTLMDKEKNANGLLDIKDVIMLIEYEDTLKNVSSLIAKGMNLNELNDEINLNIKHRKETYSDNIILNSLKTESERRRRKTNLQTNNIQKGVLQNAIKSLDIEKVNTAIKMQNFQKTFANDNEFIRKINNIVNVMKLSPEIIDTLSFDEKKNLNNITSIMNITKDSINGDSVVIEMVKQELRKKFGYKKNENDIVEERHRTR